MDSVMLCTAREHSLFLSGLGRNPLIPEQGIPASSQQRQGTIWTGISQKSPRKEDVGFSSLRALTVIPGGKGEHQNQQGV